MLLLDGSLTRVIEEEDLCSLAGSDAVARAGLVLLSVEEGDYEAAKEHFANLQLAWPKADADLPIVRRIATAMAEIEG